MDGGFLFSIKNGTLDGMHEEVYKQNILDHYKHPHNCGALSECTLSQKGINASCGDRIELFLDIQGDRIEDVSFEGTGCAISIASTSMLTDKIKGMTLKEAELLTPGTIYDMLGIQVSPSRTKCALLSYEALTEVLKQYLYNN